MVAVIAGASVLTAFFLYRTGQLYLEKRALAEAVPQWHQDVDVDGDREQSAADRIEYQGKVYRRNTYVKAILCMGIDRPGRKPWSPGPEARQMQSSLLRRIWPGIRLSS